MNILNQTSTIPDRYGGALKRNHFVEGSLRDAESRISASIQIDTGSRQSIEDDGALRVQIGSETLFNIG